MWSCEIEKLTANLSESISENSTFYEMQLPFSSLSTEHFLIGIWGGAKTSKFTLINNLKLSTHNINFFWLYTPMSSVQVNNHHEPYYEEVGEAMCTLPSHSISPQARSTFYVHTCKQILYFKSLRKPQNKIIMNTWVPNWDSQLNEVSNSEGFIMSLNWLWLKCVLGERNIKWKTELYREMKNAGDKAREWMCTSQSHSRSLQQGSWTILTIYGQDGLAPLRIPTIYSCQASSPHHQIGFGFVFDGICQSQEIYKY